jgi:hypothetical protein
MLDILKEIEEIDGQAYRMAEKVVREPSRRIRLASKANTLTERLNTIAEGLERTYPAVYIKISDQISEALLDLSFVEMDCDTTSLRLWQVIEAENLRRK